ncbi:hypothetical protein ACI3KS_05090 [Microbacterium sp. ZW T5_45]|uniref:hypothetical protein n=1 Tax=Microbacterium sp. ZW T5_45 TaxID=3378080 RepID=UPI003851F0E3
MNEEADVILQGLDARDPVLVRKATFIQLTSTGDALVEMMSSRFTAEFGAGFIPAAGETVRIISIGARHLMFPARPLPGVGTIMTVSNGICTVQTSTGTYQMRYVSPTAPTSGQQVGISWSEVPFVIGPFSGQDPPPPPPPPDPIPPAVRSAVFSPIDTGSHNNGSSNYWQPQPWASDSTFGGWFYGTQIRDTIPASATLVSLEFFVAWASRYGSAPNFGLHPLAEKNGQLSFTDVTAWTPGSDWQTPPNAQAWFNALKQGGSRLGVGLSHGGFNKFASRAQNALSGALRISWRS